jgi:hypothetical protein
MRDINIQGRKKLFLLVFIIMELDIMIPVLVGLLLRILIVVVGVFLGIVFNSESASGDLENPIEKGDTFFKGNPGIETRVPPFNRDNSSSQREEFPLTEPELNINSFPGKGIETPNIIKDFEPVPDLKTPDVIPFPFEEEIQPELEKSSNDIGPKYNRKKIQQKAK